MVRVVWINSVGIEASLDEILEESSAIRSIHYSHVDWY